MSLPGWATTEGTANYRKRFEGRLSADHFREQQGLWLSSIGIGTYRFKVIQLPFNLAMHEALTKKNQELDGEKLSTLEAAQTLGITVMCSASILQGQLARNLPPIVSEVFNGLETDAQRSLQFVRSAPGAAVALVGMKQISHVEENLKVAQLPPVPWERYVKLFKESEKT